MVAYLFGELCCRLTGKLGFILVGVGALFRKCVAEMGPLCWGIPKLFNPPETKHEPPHDKTDKMAGAPSEDSDESGHRWTESSLSLWRKLGSLATHWAHSEDSDQTGRMPRLIRVFAGHTVTLLVLSCRGSHANSLLLELTETDKVGIWW